MRSALINHVVQAAGGGAAAASDGALIAAMIAQGAVAAWNFNEESGAIIDQTGNGHDTSVTNVTYQNWTGPDGVVRAAIAGTTSVPTSTDLDPVTTGLTFVCACEFTSTLEFFLAKKASSGANDTWDVSWNPAFATDSIAAAIRNTASGAADLDIYGGLGNTPGHLGLHLLIVGFTAAGAVVQSARLDGGAITFSNFAATGTPQVSAAGPLNLGNNQGAGLLARPGPMAIFKDVPANLGTEIAALEAAALVDGWF